MLKCVRIVSAVFLLTLAAAPSQGATDAAIPDVVSVQEATLEVGVSRPVRIALTNDRITVAFNFGLVFNSVDSGFAKYDSVVFIGRMGSPNILNLRLGGGVNVDGVSPDTIVTSAFLAGSEKLPLGPGSGDLYAVYLTGLRPGLMQITNGFLPPGGDFAMIEKIGDFNTDFYFPGFTGRTITVSPAGTLVCGNVDASPDASVDIGDLTQLVDFLFISFATPPGIGAANVDGSPDGSVDIGDLTVLVNFLFNQGTVSC